MSNKLRPYTPFSQRNGYEPLPPQLQIGELSAEIRRLVKYYFSLEIERASFDSGSRRLLRKSWERLANDFWVEFLHNEPENFSSNALEFKRIVSIRLDKAPIGHFFDVVEFLARHPCSSTEFVSDMRSALIKARAAYRFVDDGFIIAVGSGEQAEAFERAVVEAAQNDAGPARSHLIAAGAALRNGDWAGSVRESIHAVESMSRRLSLGATKLSDALAEIEKRGHLHRGLKRAFEALYGYSSQQEGVRHPLVFDDEAKVDEADALFMLGACASFVSYLLAQETKSKASAPSE